AAHMLLGSEEKWLATVPIFLSHLGIMASTIPASLLMAAIGRRAGFSLGAVLGIVFGGTGCLALYLESFPLLCGAALLQGVQAGSSGYFRLPAADATDPASRAKAISAVMAGGVVAAVIGPQVAKWAVDWLAPLAFAGVYVAMAFFSAGVLLLVQLLRIPGLSAAERASGGRPLAAVLRQPAFRVALGPSVLRSRVRLSTQ